MRRRDATAHCPDLVLVPHSPERDARTFETVLGVIEQVSASVTPIRPGLCALAVPSRFYGGEAEAGGGGRRAVGGRGGVGLPAGDRRQHLHRRAGGPAGPGPGQRGGAGREGAGFLVPPAGRGAGGGRPGQPVPAAGPEDPRRPGRAACSRRGHPVRRAGQLAAPAGPGDGPAAGGRPPATLAVGSARRLRPRAGDDRADRVQHPADRGAFRRRTVPARSGLHRGVDRGQRGPWLVGFTGPGPIPGGSAPPT